MPHITVCSSARMAGVLDQQAFVRRIHPLVTETTGSTGVCKTFFHTADATYIGEDPDNDDNDNSDRDANDGAGADADAAFVHVEIGLLPGRDEELKADLSRAVLRLLDRQLPPDPAHRQVRSVEVRDLSPSYLLSDSSQSTRRRARTPRPALP